MTGVHNQFELTPILSIGIFIGVLTALICVIIAIVAAIKLRTTTDKQQHQQQTNNKNNNLLKRPGNLPIKEKISLPLSQSEDMYDEKNPDVVPSNEGNFLLFFICLYMYMYIHSFDSLVHISVYYKDTIY